MWVAGGSALVWEVAGLCRPGSLLTRLLLEASAPSTRGPFAPPWLLLHVQAPLLALPELMRAAGWNSFLQHQETPPATDRHTALALGALNTHPEECLPARSWRPQGLAGAAPAGQGERRRSQRSWEGPGGGSVHTKGCARDLSPGAGREGGLQGLYSFS